VQTFIHSHAKFEDDTLANIQPVKVMVDDVTKTVPVCSGFSEALWCLKWKFEQNGVGAVQT